MNPLNRKVFMVEIVSAGDPNLNSVLDTRSPGVGYVQVDITPNLLWRKIREGENGWDLERELPEGV